MRFHIPGIPHTVTSKKYISCAYTQKVFKLCAMLKKLGHEVYHYGCEGSNPDCTEDVTVVSEDFRNQFYPFDSEKQFAYDTKDRLHALFYSRTIEEIQKRKKEKDFLLCAWGWGHEPIARGLDENILKVESGIGYKDVFSKYRVFESYTWMSFVYGAKGIENGNWYDSVIPNFFELEDFDYNSEKEDYYLYLGRIVHRKGVDVAVQTTKEIGARLVIAGQGTLTNPGENLNITESHVEYIGFADVEKRRKLLSKAKAVFMPTYYIEPFGGVSIEAAFSGTPVISSDWGVFAENIIHGKTGYRCRTLEQFAWAAENITRINPSDCREFAITNFTTDRVAKMYQEYFESLYDLWGDGWYSKRKNRTDLDWLIKEYP